MIHPTAIIDPAAELGEAAIAVKLDVTDQASIDGAVAEAAAALGRIDILINNAAIFSAAPIVEITREDYQRVFDINVGGALFTMQAVARHMIEAGVKGKIINMASQAGRRGEPLVAVYCATKAAVISVTQSAGLDLIRHGINVNAIAPGVVDGDHWDGVDAFFAKYEGKAPGQKKKEVGEAVPYGRMGAAEDLTGMAVFLATAELIPLSNATLDRLAIERPRYDRKALTPGIVHIGVGNFHRAHQAWYLHRLMQAGEAHDWAIIGAGVRPFDEAQRQKMAAQDYLTTLIELDPAGTSVEVVGSSGTWRYQDGGWVALPVRVPVPITGLNSVQYQISVRQC